MRQQRFELLEAERLSVLVLRLDDAVRQIDDGVAFLQVDLGGVRADRAADPERQRRYFDPAWGLPFAQKVGIEMAGVRVTDRAALEIENRECKRHEGAALGRAEDEIVEAMEERRFFGALLDERGDGRLNHRHDQAGRQTMSGDVADSHGQSRLVDVEDVVVIAADGRSRLEVSRERHAAELRPFLRQKVALDGCCDLDLALQPFVLGDIHQQRGDRLRHAVERLRHLAELVPRFHGDAIGEVAPLDRFRSFFDPVHGARDRENQHGREEDCQRVKDEQQHRHRGGELQQAADVAVRLRAEIEVKEVLEGIDDQREQLVPVVEAGAAVPVGQRGDVGPDDFAKNGAEDELRYLALVIVVDIE